MGSAGAVSRRSVLRAAVAAGVAVGPMSACSGTQAGGGRPSSTAGAATSGTGSPGPSSPALPAAARVYGPADGPGVMLLHAWWGVTPGVVQWAERLSGAGARVVLPDLYGGRTARSPDEAEALADGLDDATVLGLLDECATWLGSAGRWDVVGWSLGAFHACRLMSQTTQPPQRAVLFYGGAPVPPTTRTRAVQLHVVPNDTYFTASEIATTVDSFASAHMSVERFDYPTLHHWFAEPGAPAFDRHGFDVAWARALGFLGLPARP